MICPRWDTVDEPSEGAGSGPTLDNVLRRGIFYEQDKTKGRQAIFIGFDGRYWKDKICYGVQVQGSWLLRTRLLPRLISTCEHVNCVECFLTITTGALFNLADGGQVGSLLPRRQICRPRLSHSNVHRCKKGRCHLVVCRAWMMPGMWMRRRLEDSACG